MGIAETTEHKQRWILAIVAVLCLLLFSFSYYPGYVSHDTAFQYWQARHHEYFSMSPVLLTILWQFTDVILAGPGGLFLLFQALYWGAVLFIISQFRRLALGWRIVLIVLLGYWPFNLLILPHLWKDVAMLICLLWSVGFFLCYQVKGSDNRLLFIAAVICSALTGMFRVDGLIAAAVLQFYFFWYRLDIRRNDDSKRSNSRYGRTGNIMGCLVFAIFCVSTTYGVKRGLEWSVNAVDQNLFPSVGLWDIAHVSDQLGRQLLPKFTFEDEEIELGELKSEIVPWSNVPIFIKGVRSGLYLPYSEDEFDVIRRLWLSIIRDYPKEYVNHRLRVFSELMRWQELPDKPDTVYRVPEMTGFRDNPSFEMNPWGLNGHVESLVTRLLDTPFLKPWVYLGLNLLCLLVFLIKYRSLRSFQFIVALLVSGLFQAAALLIIAPSAEIRYLLWLVNASLLGVILLCIQLWGRSRIH